MGSKHLSLDERISIQEYIVKGYNKSETALALNRSIAVISREIKNHRFKKKKISYDNPYNCKYFESCKVCTGKCFSFAEKECIRRDRNIGACNNCTKLKSCTKDHYIYDAKKAHQSYLETLKDCRQGVNLTRNELVDMAHIIAPPLKKGQSVYTVLQNHPEIKICAKTLYNYIEMGLFKDWGLDNFTLRRQLKRKQRSKKLHKRNSPAMYKGHEYEDYLTFIKIHPELTTTEMDTVYNAQNGPYIQTFIFESTGFMIGRLHTEKTADSMSKSLDYFQDKLSSKQYQKLFSIILTDRGTEFSKPQQFEVNMSTGEVRSNIFYCDPQMPSQKPHVENNHILLRYIIPKKFDMSQLTQEKLDLIFSHINSFPREKLGGKTPYETFKFIYGKDLIERLNIKEIKKDDVDLTPSLLK